MAAILLGNRSDPNGSKITEAEVQWMRANPGRCPDCYGRLLAGPCGGASQNFMCGDCLSKFNDCAGVWIERIGRMSVEEANRHGIKPITDGNANAVWSMKIGISTFAQKNVPDPEALLTKIRENWDRRVPGKGRTDLTQVVLVPIPTDGYFTRTATISEDMLYEAFFSRRAEGEDPYIVVKAVGYKPRGLRWLGWKLGLVKPLPVKADPAKFVKAVCYSADTLMEDNGQRSGDFDWEVVAVVTSSLDNEPMEPLTMARNWLRKPGGTFAPYELGDIMESVYFWSDKVKV